MVILKKTIIFQCLRGGPTPTFSRGAQLVPGGGGGGGGGEGGPNANFYRNPYITCDFPWGGPDPLSPLWIRTC